MFSNTLSFLSSLNVNDQVILMMSDNRALRKVFVLWREVVPGGWNLVFFYIPHQNHSGNDVNENEFDGACGKYCGEDKYIHDFGGEK